jgi:hypothetical protein
VALRFHKMETGGRLTAANVFFAANVAFREKATFSR